MKLENLKYNHEEAKKAYTHLRDTYNKLIQPLTNAIIRGEKPSEAEYNAAMTRMRMLKAVEPTSNISPLTWGLLICYMTAPTFKLWLKNLRVPDTLPANWNTCNMWEVQ